MYNLNSETIIDHNLCLFCKGKDIMKNKMFSKICMVVLITVFALTGSKASVDVNTAPAASDAPEVTEAPEETKAPEEEKAEEAEAPEEETTEESEASAENDGRIVDEARNIDADGELMDFYGKNIDDLTADFPNLEIMAQEGMYDKEGAQYIDKEEEFDGVLSGPSFDVDKDFNIVGITYSGRRFVLAGLCAAVDIKDAIAIVKENGWEFSDVDFAHGTAQYVANYTKDDMILTIVSTDEGEFGKTEESDLTGFVETVAVTKK